MAKEEGGNSLKHTPKAEMTRQHILDTALRLFGTQGYEQTTMRDIAAAADCSLGLAYRYFAGKEDFVLELYRWLAEQLETQAHSLPAGSLADRFQYLMRALFNLMTPHRLTLGALFGAALNPLSRAGLFGKEGAEIRQRARSVYVMVVAEAKDAPRPAQTGDLATLLYGIQLALVLFWLQDLGTGAVRTDELVVLVHDLLQRLRSLLRLPWVAQTLARTVRIIGPLLGNEDA